jgi:hypothetical protein
VFGMIVIVVSMMVMLVRVGIAHACQHARPARPGRPALRLSTTALAPSC